MEVRDIDDFLIHIQDRPVDITEYELDIEPADNGSKSVYTVYCKNCGEKIEEIHIDGEQVGMDETYHTVFSHILHEKDVDKYCSLECASSGEL